MIGFVGFLIGAALMRVWIDAFEKAEHPDKLHTAVVALEAISNLHPPGTPGNVAGHEARLALVEIAYADTAS